MRICIIAILIFFSGNLVFADEHIDSLINEFNNRIKAEEYNYEVFMIAWEIGEQLASEDIDKALEFTYKTQEIAIRIGNDTLQNILLTNFAKIYRYQGIYDNAIEYYSKAAYNTKDVDHGAYAWNLIHLGNIYYLKELYDEALVKYKESITVFEKRLNSTSTDSIGIINSYYALAVAYNNIGLCKLKKNDIKKAKLNFTKAKTYREKTNIRIGIAYQYYYNARVDMLENKFDDALDDINRSLLIIDSAIAESKLDYFNKKIAKSEFLFLKCELFFRYKNDFETAYKIFNNIEDILNNINNNRDRIHLSLRLAEWEIEKELYQTARKRLLKIREETKNTKYNNIKQSALLLLAKIYEESGNYSEANNMYKRYYIYNDSINHRQDSINFKWVEQSVENEMKARQIELMEKNRLLSDQKIKNKNNLIFMLLLISMLILAIVIIQFRSQVRISKINDILAESEKELKEALATKDKFFSIIAHDLKSPMISFSGSLEMLNNKYDEIDEDDRKEFIHELDNASSNILELLENLLTWSRAQNNKIPFEPVKVNANKLVYHATELLKEFAAGKQVELKNQMPENLEIVADVNMFKTILRNLVSNAVKFSYQGNDIDIGYLNKDNKSVFFVKDYGAGIPKEKIPEIFKIDNNYTTLGTNKEKGTGLGLILCKEFVQKHNGDIWLESEPNKGTTVFFTLE
jgi:signal transduction histidine kinase